MKQFKRQLQFGAFKKLAVGIIAAGLVTGCSGDDAKIATQNLPTSNEIVLSEPDLSGEWYINYNNPRSMTYSTVLLVKVEGKTLPDQNVSISENGAPFWVTEGVIDDTLMSFRWSYKSPKNGGASELVLWDFKFQGHYRLDKDGEVVYEGTFTGTELNNICEYSKVETPPGERLANGDCPRHPVTGTWSARRNWPF